MRIGIIVTSLTLLFGVNFMTGQIIEPKEDAILQIKYEKTVCRDTIGRSFSRTSPMVLRIGRTSSMFYPEKLMFTDSMDYFYPEVRLISLDEIIKDGGKAITNLKGWEKEYLFRNVHDNETMACQSFASYHIGYTEKTELPEWTIRNDSIKNILGYECIYATCTYRGRNWRAWFTPEIPLREGPWKLAGLPGVVLEAYDSGKQYVFEATSIRTGNLPKVGVFIYNRKPLDMLKDRQTYLRTLFYLRLKRKFMDEVSLLTDFKPSKTDRVPRYDYEETDYPHE